ncbi:hypothetical protein L916_16818, partial [Phytophthora nicotianae]
MPVGSGHRTPNKVNAAEGTGGLEQGAQCGRWTETVQRSGTGGLVLRSVAGSADSEACAL